MSDHKKDIDKFCQDMTPFGESIGERSRKARKNMRLDIDLDKDTLEECVRKLILKVNQLENELYCLRRCVDDITIKN